MDPRSPISLFAEIATVAEAADPLPERVTAGQPTATIETLFESPDGKVLAGTWTCTPGRWRVAYDEIEYCRILTGNGALIAEDGAVRRIEAGDEFMVPAGFTGEWLVETTMTKRYLVLLP